MTIQRGVDDLDGQQKQIMAENTQRQRNNQGIHNQRGQPNEKVVLALEKIKKITDSNGIQTDIKQTDDCQPKACGHGEIMQFKRLKGGKEIGHRQTEENV